MDDAQADKIREMVAVMRHACTLDEQGEYAAAERIAQLAEENRVRLRSYWDGSIIVLLLPF